MEGSEERNLLVPPNILIVADDTYVFGPVSLCVKRCHLWDYDFPNKKKDRD